MKEKRHAVLKRRDDFAGALKDAEKMQKETKQSYDQVHKEYEIVKAHAEREIRAGRTHTLVWERTITLKKNAVKQADQPEDEIISMQQILRRKYSPGKGVGTK